MSNGNNESGASPNALEEYVGANASSLQQVSSDDAANALESASGGGLSTNAVFMNFSGKFGTFSLGAGDALIDNYDPTGARMVVIVDAITEGFIHWGNGSVVERIEWNLFEREAKAVNRNELEPAVYKDKKGNIDKKSGWFDLRSFVMYFADGQGLMGEEEDVYYKFSTNSKSGVIQVGTLLRAIATQMRNGDPHYPVIELGCEEFEAHNQKNFKPVFNVLTWLSEEEAHALVPTRDLDSLLVERGDGTDASDEVEAEEPAPVKAAKKAPASKVSAKKVAVKAVAKKAKARTNPPKEPVSDEDDGGGGTTDDAEIPAFLRT